MNKTVMPAKFLIPSNVPLSKWAVVACDQYTSEKKYWQQLSEYVGDSPSALNIIFPEVYLQEDNSQIIEKINENMDKYLNEEGFFNEFEGYVLTIRKTAYNVTRVGVVAAINLEDYSFDGDKNAKIRSTEGTVLERIPPRVEIRQNAKLELPHIMLLANDKKQSVIEVLYKNRENYKKLYDFDLNMNGGHIEGYLIPSDVDLFEMFSSAANSNTLFLVGDGNHSLATAKTCYNNQKEKGEDVSLSQYCLCEIVNLFSDGITFEPIHRLVKGVDVGDFLNGLSLMVGGNGNIGIITKDYDKFFNSPRETALCYEAVQGYIDTYLEINGGEVDYIHGIDSLRELAEESGSIGIVMPKLDKNELFDEINENGALPRKTFSMGEASEKRYYLESRKIK